MIATERLGPVVRSLPWSGVAALVERARDGNREAYGELVEQFQRTVYAISLRRLGDPSEALELTQEVFLHVMGRLDQLREPERFAGWLRQVAVRMSINRATRLKAPSSLEDEILEGYAGGGSQPLDELISRERASRLWEALGELKPLDREALQAFYIRGLSLVEIAEELEVPIGTIKRRLHTARKRLKDLLEAGSTDADEWSMSQEEDEEQEECELMAAG